MIPIACKITNFSLCLYIHTWLCINSVTCTILFAVKCQTSVYQPCRSVDIVDWRNHFTVANLDQLHLLLDEVGLISYCMTCWPAICYPDTTRSKETWPFNSPGALSSWVHHETTGYYWRGTCKERPGWNIQSIHHYIICRVPSQLLTFCPVKILYHSVYCFSWFFSLTSRLSCASLTSKIPDSNVPIAACTLAV